MEGSITLISSENTEKTVSSSSVKNSKFLLEKANAGENKIKLNDINDATLSLVVDYLTQYESTEPTKIPDSLKSSDLKSQVSEWDFNFIDAVSYEQTFHLINAGALLEMDHLHDLACSKIADFMKGKTPEEVAKEFTIECQLTTEEARNLGLEAGAGDA